jgi:hypothetical protein
MPTQKDFHTVFEQLKKIMQKYEPRLVVIQDKPESYSLNTPFSEKYSKELFFGAVQVKKNYVSYYLMPVYMYPELLAGISDSLKKRMQGKSCFNFKASDKALFDELARLTRKSVDRVKQEKLF